MRIAQIATASSPVSRNSAGSVEYLVWLLTRELLRLGHEVTVFGVAGSETEAKLVATLPGPYAQNGSFDDWQLCEWVNLCRAVAQSADFDILHSHAYLWGIPLEPFARAPLLHTTHIVPDENMARLWQTNPASAVSAISQHQWSSFPHLHPSAVIPHGVDLSEFTFRAQPDDYVCYLGRFVSGKGPRQAISLARQLDLRLVLAGPSSPYFREQVLPLVDGKNVQYVGPVNSVERSKLLGGARALLYPIQYPEAFGLVLVEAMLCGTPVAAMRLGAVPEILDEGITGCSATTLEDLPKAILKTFSLDRRKVRERAEGRFTAEAMARSYAALYQNLIRSRL
jgi:glycosyltransferase involved in cell wall biosynthesis